MTVLGFLIIITGVAMMGTGVGAIPGLVVIAVGGYAIALDNKTKEEMQAAEIGDGCLGNMTLILAIGAVFFLLAMTMTDGQFASDAAGAIDRNVNQPLEQFEQDYRSRPNYMGR